MRIPLVTSIWRGLTGMDDSLRLACAAAKPIYESGEPERALTRSVAVVGLPRPEPLVPTALACVRRAESDVIATRCHRCLQSVIRHGFLVAFGPVVMKQVVSGTDCIAVHTRATRIRRPKGAPASRAQGKRCSMRWNASVAPAEPRPRSRRADRSVRDHDGCQRRSRLARNSAAKTGLARRIWAIRRTVPRLLVGWLSHAISNSRSDVAESS
jgi:hypothetical protein